MSKKKLYCEFQGQIHLVEEEKTWARPGYGPRSEYKIGAAVRKVSDTFEDRLFIETFEKNNPGVKWFAYRAIQDAAAREKGSWALGSVVVNLIRRKLPAGTARCSKDQIKACVEGLRALGALDRRS